MVHAETKFKDKKPMNVLIVDDDTDSASLLISVFNRLGCETTCSLNPHEAHKKICSQKADIIILDWILGQRTNAHTVTDKCADILSKFGILRSHEDRPKIITYSSLETSQIDLLTNPYFLHLDHWQKPISPQELWKRALALLQKMEYK